MADKSPLLHALEKNTKALERVSKMTKKKPASDSAPTTKKDTTPIEALTLAGAAGQQLTKRKEAIKQSIGSRISAASSFVRGGFLRKIPSLGVGGFLADTLETRRESIQAKKEEDKKNKDTIQTRLQTIKGMKEENPDMTTAEALAQIRGGGVEEKKESEDKEKESEKSSSMLDELKVISKSIISLVELLKPDKAEDREKTLEEGRKKKPGDDGQMELFPDDEDAASVAGGSFLGSLLGTGGMKKMFARMMPALGGALAGAVKFLGPVALLAGGAMAGYAAGTWIFDNIVGPAMDKYEKEKQDEMNRARVTEHKATMVKGTQEQAVQLDTGEVVTKSQAIAAAGGEEAYAAQVESGAFREMTHQVNKETGDVMFGQQEIEAGLGEKERFDALKKSEAIRTGMGRMDFETGEMREATEDEAKLEAYHKEKRAIEIFLNKAHLSQVAMLQKAKAMTDETGYVDANKLDRAYRTEMFKYGDLIDSMHADSRISPEAKDILEDLIDPFVISRTAWHNYGARLLFNQKDNWNELLHGPQGIHTSSYVKSPLWPPTPWWNTIQTGTNNTWMQPLSFRKGGLIRAGGGKLAMLHGDEAIIPLSQLANGAGLGGVHPANKAMLMQLAENATGKMTTSRGGGGSPIVVSAPVANNTTIRREKKIISSTSVRSVENSLLLAERGIIS